MTLNLKLAAATANAEADAACALANGGKLQIYDSTGTGQPATADTAVSTQVKLAEFTLANPAFAASSGGVATAEAVTDTTVLATGTATWFRVLSSGGAKVFDGSAGTASTDLILNSAALSSGADIGVSSWTYTQPEHA